ncbi:MAG TPA: hypothetical protein VJG32_16805 [Anaerolineae bacterium]|nr:hypothetical protein [Anaerolineae bacterium]
MSFLLAPVAKPASGCVIQHIRLPLRTIKEKREIVENVAPKDDLAAGFVASDLHARKTCVLDLQLHQEERNRMGIAPQAAYSSLADRVSFDSANQ